MHQTVFENEHFIMVLKPSGWLSVPSRIGSEDHRPCLGTSLQEQLGKQIWPLHRLDFEVSGLIVFAKSEAAHKAGNKWFESNQIKKTYLAWTPAPAPPFDDTDQQLWKSKLVRGKKRTFEAEHGKNAETLAHIVGSTSWQGQTFTCWHLQPLTGRSHQLRFELYKRQIPIVGDTLYGSTVAFAKDQIALHSFKLDFSRCDNYTTFNLPGFFEIPAEIPLPPATEPR